MDYKCLTFLAIYPFSFPRMQVMMGAPLSALLNGSTTTLASVEACLKLKRSILEVLDRGRLETCCAQIRHSKPWVVVVAALQAQRVAQQTILKFRYMLCPSDLPLGESSGTSLVVLFSSFKVSFSS